MSEELIGTVSDYFARPCVAAFKLTGPLRLGDRIHIKGHTTDIEVLVESMQIENEPVNEAGRGDSVGVKVGENVRQHDKVYRVVD